MRLRLMPAVADAELADLLDAAHGYARRQAGQNHELAEVLIDAATDGLCRAHRQFDPVRGAWKAFAWRVIKSEVRVAVRRYRDRKAARPGFGPLPDIDPAARTLPSAGAIPLPAVVRDLPADLRDAVRFYYVDGHDLEDTGLLMGCGKDLVRKKLAEAAAMLAPDLDAPTRTKGTRRLERG